MHIEEYTELDFEHVILETPTDPHTDCEHCGASQLYVTPGIWTCDICAGINHKDMEV